MLDQFNGMPVHALLIHATVVFVPLLALSAAAFALVPRLRSRLGWVAALLAIGAPLSALLAKLSGGEFRNRLIANGMKGEALDRINTHMGYGDLTFWFSLVLGIATGLMLFFASRRSGSPELPRFVDLGLSVVVVVLAAITTYYVLRTGDSGAQAVWRVS